MFTTLSTASRSLPHPANNSRLDGINHWIAKGSKQWCRLQGCKRTWYIIAENVMLVFMLNVSDDITVTRAV